VDADGGPFAATLVSDIGAGARLTVDIRRYDSVDALRDAAARGIVQVGIVIPAGHSAAIAAGGDAPVTVVAPPTGMGSAIAATARDAIARQAALVRAARFAAETAGIPFEVALDRARAARQDVAGVSVTVEPVNAASTESGPYDAGAASQLVLFMFLTSLTAATELVLTRQLGVSRRMFGTPTGLATIVLGEALARIAFALLQGLFIVGASALLFGVRWGDPVAVAGIVIAFAFVAGGAAMIVGGLASNPSQAGALGPALGMLLGLFGGAMVPTEVFPEAMRTLSRITPHAWAMDALRALGEPGTGLVQVAPQVGVLAAFALACFADATLRFRRVLRSGA
jgi:ABC-2 type transport system permease protein